MICLRNNALPLCITLLRNISRLSGDQSESLTINPLFKEAAMPGRRQEDQIQEKHEPLIYYRRKADKVLIFSFLTAALLLCYYLYSGMREFNIVLFGIIIITSIIFGFVVSRLSFSLYSYFTRK